MTYKVLPLSFPFNDDKYFWEECVKDKITPIFNRNGYYLDRKNNKTWLEINGEAYLYSHREYFEYELVTSEGNNWLEEPVFQAIKIVINNRLADKKLRKRYYIELDRRLLRKTYRDNKLICFKMVKERK